MPILRYLCRVGTCTVLFVLYTPFLSRIEKYGLLWQLAFNSCFMMIFVYNGVMVGCIYMKNYYCTPLLLDIYLTAKAESSYLGQLYISNLGKENPYLMQGSPRPKHQQFIYGK